MVDYITLLGFDFGLRHIGVAVGQTFTRAAQPLTSLQAERGVPNWNELTKLVQTWKPQAFVVGIPLNMDDTEQPLTHKAKTFAEQLHQHYQLPVHHVDERLSSVEAKARLFAQGGFKALQKKSIDSLAAKLILETWLMQQ